MKLYFAPDTCSFSPHIVLQELGLPYDLVRVNNRTKRTSEGGDFLAVNPKGYVAALQLENGEVLTEGPALVQYLADLKPDAGLAPANGTLERVRLQEWLNFITSEIHGGSALLFNKDLPEAVQNLFKARLFKRFDLIEATLKKTPYLMGGSFTVVDAYLFTVLGWMPGFAIDLSRWPNIPPYIQRIEARASVAAARIREAEIPPVN
ncbi:glutathione transferase GstA [Rhizobium tumorigenes]|uniref:Glutathione transferase GstA n=1 Tax=Rhizobium tumorigenes TaxID=2041385 RepID=A0AAF1K9V9_9HYPH|nr:glutathione transferase GstA [Rhizobium tumorigenes]WFR98339.1 glutathione transferase GstA [Rhizobium tumorigenes]WFS03114.1 glutathione transferase GstA [Rhizobium tumorigenes]WFS03854.1 glutathione transferase GstA [Rhizobium tumorigenes]